MESGEWLIEKFIQIPMTPSKFTFTNRNILLWELSLITGCTV